MTSVMVFPVSSSSASSSSASCSPRRYIEHHVTKLDTLAGIAIRYGVEGHKWSLFTSPKPYYIKLLTSLSKSSLSAPGSSPPSSITVKMSEGEDSDHVGKQAREFFHLLDDTIVLKYRATSGTRLADVISIIINTNSVVESEIYGTIRVDDCNGSFFMFYVEREDSIPVPQSRNIALSQGMRAICADGSFTVSMNLKDKSKGDIELISGQFGSETPHLLRKRKVVNVDGNFGSSARVEYVVFPGAIEANIWAEFYSEHKDALSSPGLHLEGKISVCYKYPDGSFVYNPDDPNQHHQISLLDGQITKLHDDDIITFNRSVVVLPIDYILSFIVNLKVKGSEEGWTFEEQFSPEEIGDLTRYREHEGKYGVIKLGCIGFQYHSSLEEVEYQKKIQRENNDLCN